jgi:hypothetical protein
LFVRKSVVEVEKELSELHRKVEGLGKELHRLEMLERMLAQHEIVLAKKIADINRLEAEVRKCVKNEDIEDIREELKKLEKHEVLLFENAKFTRELTSELSKIKESHKLTRKQVFENEHVSKGELEERFDIIREALKDVEHMRKTHHKKVGKDELAAIRDELHDRMSQLEYQNKLIMKYLKRVDEIFQKKI